VAVSTFAVTPEMVRNSFFPHVASFSTTTRPNLVTVEREVSWAAADLDARLQAKSVSAASITDTTSAAYFWCQQTIALGVAIALVGVMSGTNPELVKSWTANLEARLTKLETQGVSALGPGASASGGSEALGPTDHISELGLDVGDTLLASSVAPVLRRDDLL
jgi:hypothetical protein